MKTIHSLQQKPKVRAEQHSDFKLGGQRTQIIKEEKQLSQLFNRKGR